MRSTDKQKKPVLTVDQLRTDDGYPSPDLIMEAYKVWGKEFGRINIVRSSPSIGDIVRALEASGNAPNKNERG